MLTIAPEDVWPCSFSGFLGCALHTLSLLDMTCVTLAVVSEELAVTDTSNLHKSSVHYHP